MARLVQVLALSLASLVGLGCLARPWSLTAYNNHGVEQAIVRVSTPAGSHDWLLAAQQIETLLVADQATSGTIAILDPDTCAVLAETQFARAPGILAIFDRGVTGEGPWELTAEPEDPDDGPAVQPDDGACQS